MRPAPPNHSSNERHGPGAWAILHGGALGDLVLTIQLALRLSRAGAAGRLHVVSRANPGNLTACRPSVTRASEERAGLHWLYAESNDPPPEALRDAVRSARILNTLGDTQSLVHRRLTCLRPAGLFSIDPRPRAGLHRHITRQWQTDLEAQGLLVPKCIHQQPERCGLAVPKELRTRGRRRLHEAMRHRRPADGDASETPVPPVVIHPGSGGRAKCWPLPNFLDVGRRLVGRGIPACFVIGPVETEWWRPEDVTAIEHDFPLLRLSDPDDLCAVLTGATAFVGNDSGPTHLAALLGTRVIAIFGASSPTVWRPLGPCVQVLSGSPITREDDWSIRPETVATAVCKSFS